MSHGHGHLQTPAKQHDPWTGDPNATPKLTRASVRFATISDRRATNWLRFVGGSDSVMSNQEVVHMADRIVKTVELKAPISRVWRALADHNEFGQWFRVKLDGPFVAGTVSIGRMTYPGYEHYPWLATVEKVEHERLLSFRWHHFDEKSGVPVAEQPTTLVEFRVEPIAEGTRLTITESGFEAIPDPRRLEVLRGNTEGWNIQANNIAAHVSPIA